MIIMSAVPILYKCHNADIDAWNDLILDILGEWCIFRTRHNFDNLLFKFHIHR